MPFCSPTPTAVFLLPTPPPAACSNGQKKRSFRSGEAAWLIHLTRDGDAVQERDQSGEFSGELALIRKDGTKFPGELSTVLFKDKNGHLRTSMIIRDITERKRTEEALRESQEFLNGIVENSPNALLITDEQGPYCE